MKLSFSQKLWLPLLISLVCLAALAVTDAWRTRAIRLEERKADLVHATEVALSVVKTFADQAAAGTIPQDEAKTKALEVVRNMRYGGSGYFTILDSQPVVLMHPFKPELQGRNMAGFTDPNGVPLYQDVVAQIKRDGHGFTTYSFSKPNAAGVFPKLSYNDSYRPWDWIFMTGVYIDDIDAAFRTALYQSIGWLAVAAALLSAVVVAINRGIRRTLGGEPAYAAQIAERIANNDLAVTVDIAATDRHSLLYSMKRMQEQLAGTIRSIKISSDSIATATSQIASGNQDLSQRTEEQAASLQETAASMEELTSTVNQNAENARQASQVAAQAVQVAERGSTIVTQVIDTMSGINASSDRIADIVGMIESIAFQTNILALNAAVEAARAGEQGRGFAVVASEVRSLAQRSSAASKEIKTLIQDSVERVRHGTEFVDSAGVTMTEIMQSVRRVTDIMGEIAAASVEQSKGIGQVSDAVSQMDSVTQQNAALVEQAAAAAASLESQASGLQSAVSIFRLR
ncbi:methyl-accepting chemotaxis protein [Trinickia caryophylli]|uniref:Methyl-accepting chemotaxis sensory transducer with Cache sensor n=1 Tax=Trinickia caryophylli TaxID=28094 RepID=A0A1X7GQ85_TRICW|nr:methyl-accepting chemotaxis protein [Trinickia caryophylli]PMS10531.1 chemotaxis protein [Trinickia caryophylli]TRX19075.1 methyl-accepting chemotaxis protein [Trinickia caryophylli]WQE10124.1 methyl-accepting chemotaxis protein [Trinickia caryophylli]SMF73136.1 methyl-accepting chemotaxis sensory transducer with Cache sensor [Trinickia caryophylli]GLU35145.1 methyl-accepting chemotaxis protein [Trinickia caryophylli]